MRSTRVSVAARLAASPHAARRAGESRASASRDGGSSPAARTIARSISSARRAWISCPHTARRVACATVALRRGLRPAEREHRRPEQRVAREAAVKLARVVVEREARSAPPRPRGSHDARTRPSRRAPAAPPPTAPRAAAPRQCSVAHRQPQRVRPGGPERGVDHSRSLVAVAERVRLKPDPADRILPPCASPTRSRSARGGASSGSSSRSSGPGRRPPCSTWARTSSRFGEGDRCTTLNFFEEHYPWPERITALGL